MLTILLVITAFWALIVWVIVEWFSQSRCLENQLASTHRLPDKPCFSREAKTVEAISLSSDLRVKVGSTSIQDAKDHPSEEKVAEYVSETVEWSLQPSRSTQVKEVNDCSARGTSFCESGSGAADSDCSLDKCQNITLSSELCIPISADLYNQGSKAVPEQNNEIVENNPHIRHNSVRPRILENGAHDVSVRSMSVSGRKGADFFNDQTWKGGALEGQIRGRTLKRNTQKEKLLRKRRRILSQLQERDIDELLRLYFFSDSPQAAAFEFATPQNIDEAIHIPVIEACRVPGCTAHFDHTGALSINRDEEPGLELSAHLREKTSSSRMKENVDEIYPVRRRKESSGWLKNANINQRQRRSLELNDPKTVSFRDYESLKSDGLIRLASRESVSHIPSFFNLQQARGKSCSLVAFDDKLLKAELGHFPWHDSSKSCEALMFRHQPTIFGTVADDQVPRDNTKRAFPQSSKGAKGGFEPGDGSHPLPEWALAEDDDNSLVYEEGVLVSGCLGALVLHATPTPTYYPDAAYLFAFLLSARLFIKPHELLQKICNLGFAQQGLVNDDINTINKEELGNFVPHMVQLLGEWSETFPYDFRDERMMVGVRTMTHRCIALQPSLRRDVTQVLHNLLNKLTQLERYEENLAKLTVPPPADILPSVSDITEACPSALILAQQLTHIELERLSYIGPEEFVQAFAKDNLESTYKDLKKTNNLESYVQWFNRLSYLVATQASSPVKKKQRIRVIETWIEVARECFNIGNFNSLMGIIAGLNMSPVARLKKTWSKVQTAKFSVLEHQMDPSSNFSSYRSTLKAAMWRSAGAVDDRQKIVIPFFSLLVKDLYFLNEGCANRLPNGHINFDKFWQLAKQVTEFMAWKQVTCPFEKDPQVLRYLQTTPVLSEPGLALASFEGEGPENSFEKERYKSLKSEFQQHHQPQQPN